MVKVLFGRRKLIETFSAKKILLIAMISIFLGDFLLTIPTNINI